jgi:hypothetical protein
MSAVTIDPMRMELLAIPLESFIPLKNSALRRRRASILNYAKSAEFHEDESNTTEKTIHEILLTMVQENILALHSDGAVNLCNLSDIIGRVFSKLGLDKSKNKSTLDIIENTTSNEQCTLEESKRQVRMNAYMVFSNLKLDC